MVFYMFSMVFYRCSVGFLQVFFGFPRIFCVFFYGFVCLLWSSILPTKKKLTWPMKLTWPFFVFFLKFKPHQKVASKGYI